MHLTVREEAMNLKEQEDVLWKGWEGGRGGLCDYIILKNKRDNFKNLAILTNS